jgi:S1-C subfamily serine protease
MPNLSKTVEIVRSGVFHVIYLNGSDNRIGSGTGFMSKGCLITNGHVFDCPPGTTSVLLRQDNRVSANKGFRIAREEFEKRRIIASPESEYDYAVLQMPELMKYHPHQFEITDPLKKRIGETVAFLGYPLDLTNLACHAGIISSFYTRNNTDVIQVDASVNPGNSGGPLFDPETGKIFGIITRRATGLTKTFNELRTVIRNNVGILQASGEVMRVGGFSLIQSTIASQNQMLIALDEIERSANVGIGYAFSCKHLLEEHQFINL